MLRVSRGGLGGRYKMQFSSKPISQMTPDAPRAPPAPHAEAAGRGRTTNENRQVGNSVQNLHSIHESIIVY